MRPVKGKRLGQEQKDLLTSRITELLLEKAPVLFAYLYGSFLNDRPFRDVDLAVYVDPDAFKDSEDILDYSLSLGAEMDMTLSGVTTDVRPLNLAPLPFRFRVITEGRLLFSHDEVRRIDLESRTRSLYFDFLPHLRFYYTSIVLGE